MSYVRKIKYGEQIGKDYDIRTAMEEASRCLLCEDSPCSKGCPAGTDPGKFIRSIRFKNIKGAAETIKENNALGGCCALICPYGNLCEKECARTGIDKPIQIGKLQRFAVEYAKNCDMKIWQAPVKKSGKKVACVGAGPASLACAAKLAINGIDVTVFDKNDKPGGMLSYGIIPSRLPQKVVDYDIDQIKALGVTFKMNTHIDRNKDLEKLLTEFDSVFIGVGLWKMVLPDITGNKLAGVYAALDFLKAARETEGNIPLGDDVIVVGGGDVAIDCAATAKQLGAKNVAIVYRRTYEEAPAYFEEWAGLQSIGVPVITRFAPDSIISGSTGRVEKMAFKSWDGVSEMVIKADTVIFAVGQKIEDDYAVLPEEKGLFVGGDMANGGSTVVQAVADGKKSAENILAYLGIKEES